MTTPTTIDEYIAGFPDEVQALLETIRATVREAAPEAKEVIKYQIPTFTFKGNLLSFAAYKSYISFYPAPLGEASFQEALRPYASGKATARFPLDQPLPLDLIREMVHFRVKEMVEKDEAKRKR